MSRLSTIYQVAVFMAAYIFLGHCNGARMDFHIPATSSSEYLRGQIEWPGSSLRAYDGPIVVIIPASNPTDRDGWLVRSVDEHWSNTRPARSLSDFFLRRGLATARFDNPGVKADSTTCRRKFEIGETSELSLPEDCFDVEPMRRLTVERYVNSIEHMLEYLQNINAARRRKLLLVGTSEGFLHVVKIVERNRVQVAGVVSIGGTVETLKEISRWQAVERPIEVLRQFDIDKDGRVTNDEISAGYINGVGRITSRVEDWFSPAGVWNLDQLGGFRGRLENSYQKVFDETRAKITSTELNWVAISDGRLIPDITESFWALHFHDITQPLRVLKRKNVPALFLWGAEDAQINISVQLSMIAEAKDAGADVEYYVYPGLHHMLGLKKDTDWFSKRLAQSLVARIVDFWSRRNDFSARK